MINPSFISSILFPISNPMPSCLVCYAKLYVKDLISLIALNWQGVRAGLPGSSSAIQGRYVARERSVSDCTCGGARGTWRFRQDAGVESGHQNYIRWFISRIRYSILINQWKKVLNLK